MTFWPEGRDTRPGMGVIWPEGRDIRPGMGAPWPKGRLLSPEGAATALVGQVTHVPGQVTHVPGQVTHVPGQVTHVLGRVTHVPGRVALEGISAAELLPYRFLDRGQGVGQLLGVLAAGLREVRPAAARPTRRRAGSPPSIYR